MAEMIRNDLSDPAKRIMVAVDANVIVGQALYSIKQDTDGRTYGFCFSRYVIPEQRRRGIASQLLREAIDWFRSSGAEYIIAQTHVSNTPLQQLFTNFGFTISGPFSGAWQYYMLKKELVDTGK
jgi:ribosomal protein S18 acetylase RimI-like enzyme